TGEIHGASVYFGAAWFDISFFEDDAGAGTGARPHAPEGEPQKVASLRWAGMSSTPLCQMSVEEGRQAAQGLTGTALTKQQKMNLFIQHVVAHEIGHD